jgi:hypothetical protein
MLECSIGELIELNQLNFGKGFTKAAKLMEGTTVLTPLNSKRKPWECKGQKGYGMALASDGSAEVSAAGAAPAASDATPMNL